MIKEHGKNSLIDQGKYKKIFVESKWIDRQYHVQDNDDVAQKYVSVYCNINQFPALPFCGTYSKPRGAISLIKHYHLRFDPKLGHGVCTIRLISCAFFSCT